MGFVYINGAWGGHAWVEAFKEGDWISLDAALLSPERADAARISFFSSSLEEGTIAGIGSLAQMYGNVDIEILAFTVDGRTVNVPDYAPPYSVNADEYENPWLGLKVRKSTAFRFHRLDAVWPETVIVALEGPAQEAVTIEKTALSPDQYLEKEGIQRRRRPIRVGRYEGLQIDLGGKSVVVATVRGENWVLIATAPAAGILLRKVAASLEINSIDR